MADSTRADFLLPSFRSLRVALEAMKWLYSSACIGVRLQQTTSTTCTLLN